MGWSDSARAAALESRRRKRRGRPFVSNDDARAKWLKNLTQEERMALSEYTRSSASKLAATALNAALRLGEPYDKNHVARLDAAIAKADNPQGAIAYRGSSVEGLLKAVGVQSAHELVGATLQDPGYLSTSVFPGVASGYAYNSLWHSRGGEKKHAMLLEIKVPPESKAAYMESMTAYYGEHELLFPRGTKVQIDKVWTEPFSDDPGDLSMAMLHVEAHVVQ